MNKIYLLGAGVNGDSVLHSLELGGAHLRGWLRVNVGFARGGDCPGSCLIVRILSRVIVLFAADNGMGVDHGVGFVNEWRW